MTNYAAGCAKLPWLVDFHSTVDGTVPNSQLAAAFARTQHDHLTKLNVDSQTPKKALTSIMCTVGPSCDSPAVLEKMMRAGMGAIRINMSFYDAAKCRELIGVIRAACDNYSRQIGRVYPLAIAVDLKGPIIRTGSFKNAQVKEIELKEGNLVSITSDPLYEEHVTEDMIYVDYQKISEIIEPGDSFYLNDGKVRLSALQVVGSIIRCLIENTGRIVARTSVLVPEIPIDLPFLSEKDAEDLQLCVSENVDILMVAVQKASDVLQCKEILGDKGSAILFFSKIDSSEAVRNVDEIIQVSDGIVISRAKLSLELPQEKLFLAQKSIAARCNGEGKPCFCAPQMLESMSKDTRPTRSEISDVANAILDGADGLLLSCETTIGRHPVEAVEQLVLVCKEAEPAVYQRQVFNSLMDRYESPVEVVHGIALSAVEISLKTNAAAIIVTTTTGRTAKLIARYRPRCPVIAVTRLGEVARRLRAYRAVDSLLYVKPTKHDWSKEVRRRLQLGISYGKLFGFVRGADALVLVSSNRPGAGFINSIKVVYASEIDAFNFDK